jgi:hypothetical protein
MARRDLQSQEDGFESTPTPQLWKIVLSRAACAHEGTPLPPLEESCGGAQQAKRLRAQDKEPNQGGRQQAS